jgi:gluconate kinase
MAIDIIFVLGPSGVGKSELSSALAKKLDYEFYEIDQHPADGIDEHKLRREWDEFWLNGRPEPFVDALRERAHAAEKKGIVLGFPSMLILKGAHLRGLSGKVRVVYLTGTEGQCLDAFLAREQKTGRGLNALHWAENNQSVFDFLKTEEAKLHIVRAFDQNGRRNRQQVLSEMAGED